MQISRKLYQQCLRTVEHQTIVGAHQPRTASIVKKLLHVQIARLRSMSSPGTLVVGIENRTSDVLLAGKNAGTLLVTKRQKIDSFVQISSIDAGSPSLLLPSHAPLKLSKAKATLDHQIFTKGEWRRASMSDHPKISIQISVDGHPDPFTNFDGIADSGAQSDLWSLDKFLSAGYSMDDLHPVPTSLNAANRSPIRIDGAFFAGKRGRTSKGKSIVCRSMVYVSRDVKSFYLSYDTLINLGILPGSFPCVGEFNNTNHNATDSSASRNDNNSDETGQPCGLICGATNDDGSICNYPKRTNVPPHPDTLPFQAIPENIDKMKMWLLERYASSTFNTCPHQRLPQMDGPPIEIHIKDDAKPVAHTKEAPIPVHWQDQVYKDLQRDEALDVIERVLYGEPVERVIDTSLPSLHLLAGGATQGHHRVFSHLVMGTIVFTT